jgi:metal-responsive CopG/Arc/MetJ family transcriptional regulator
MGSVKISITMEEHLLREVDRWVAEVRYPNRTRAIQAAVREKLERARRRRLAEEATKLDPKEERALAEEGTAGSQMWLAY